MEASVPGDSIEADSVSDAVMHALQALAEPDREVLLLSVWEELDRSQIARVLGCSKPNVSVRLHRARQRFAAALEEASKSSPRSVLIAGGASDVR